MTRSTYRRRAITLAVAGLTLTGIAACGEAPRTDAPAKSPDPTPIQTATAEPADTGLVPPEPHEAAQKGNKAGAIAALRHFYALVDYAQLSGDTEPLARWGADECRKCATGLKWIRSIHRNHGSIVGGDHSLTNTFADELQANLHAVRIWQIDTTVEYTQQEVRESRTAEGKLISAGSYRNSYLVRFRDDTWEVLDWEWIESDPQ